MLKGYEFEKRRFVLFTPAELKTLAAGAPNRKGRWQSASLHGVHRSRLPLLRAPHRDGRE
jgi:hypothetical protein